LHAGTFSHKEILLGRSQRTDEGFAPQRILVVDDNVDSADSLALLLACTEYDIRTAYHGLEAVEFARAFNPHLVILDLDMPVMNGFNAAPTLRVSDPTGAVLRLVALSAHVGPADRVEARRSGFDLILPKPVEGQAMRRLVNSVLRDSRHR
jgi:CheY-like chemotaxis protein